MSIQLFQSVLNGPLPGAGTAYASSVVLTDVSSTAFPYATTPNQLIVGSWLHLTAFGVFSNTGTPTLLLGFYYGGVAGTALAASTAITTTSGVTNVPWRMELDVICRSIGTSGTVMCNGYLDLGTSVSAVTHIPLPQVALATVTVDTTLSKLISVGAQWGTNSGSNTLTCHGFGIEQRV